MTRSRRASWLALHLTLIVPAVAAAQSPPWTVTISPSANPQPIGLCGYVALAVFDPSTKDTPRRPNGVRLSMADFDMTVATPDGKSAVGQYASAYAWSVCGCRGATPGTVATITASYPAQTLKPELRVPGVEFTATSELPLGAGRFPGNPPACDAAAKIAVTTRPSSDAPPPPGATATAPTPAATLPMASTVAAVPATAPVRATAPTSEPLTLRPGSPPPAIPPPAPVSIQFIGTPAVAKIWWNPPGPSAPSGVAPLTPQQTPAANAPVAFDVERWKPDAPDCCRNQVTDLKGTEWIDGTGFPLPGVYRYKVTAVSAAGLRTSTEASFTRPDPANPSAPWLEKKSGMMRVWWRPVSGASYYMVWGPGLPDSGTKVTEPRPPCLVPKTGLFTGGCPSPMPTAAEFSTPASIELWNATHNRRVIVGIPTTPGTNTWTIGAFYAPGPVSSPAAEFAKVSFPVAAPPPVLSNRFRVSVLGFKATSDTHDDDLFKQDGKGDEIYVAAIVCTATRPALPPPPQCAPVRRSAVHGDVLNFPQRVKAGSASPTGGIQGGDLVGSALTDGPLTPGSAGSFPLVLWEGVLTAGKEAVWVAPSLWESDNNDLPMVLWSTEITARLMTGPTPFYLMDFVDVRNFAGGDYCGHLLPMGNDRPIGVQGVGRVPPGGPYCMAIPITRESAERSLAKAEANGQHTVLMAMNLDELLGDGSGQNGVRYVLYLRLERLPAVQQGVVAP